MVNIHDWPPANGAQGNDPGHDLGPNLFGEDLGEHRLGVCSVA